MLNGDQEFLKCLGVHSSSFCQVVQVSLFFLLFVLGFPICSVIIVSDHGIFAYSVNEWSRRAGVFSGEGTRETSTTFQEWSYNFQIGA